MLQRQVERILESHDYSWCWWKGCFDVAARKKELLLLKLLDNVDSFQEEQALNLRILSDRFDAVASLIGTHTRYEELGDNVVYERFSVPTFTPETLDNILCAHYPFLFRRKGGLFREVNPQKLRRARESAGLSQVQLADSVGMSKKSIYEHEHRAMKGRADVVERIENLLHAEISAAYAPSSLGAEKKQKAQNAFEGKISRELKKKGFETDFVRKAPFNIIAEERFLIVSDAEQDALRIKRKIRSLEEFSGISGKPTIIITEKELSADVPVIAHKQLKEMDIKELKKIAKR